MSLAPDTFALSGFGCPLGDVITHGNGSATLITIVDRRGIYVVNVTVGTGTGT